MTAAALLLIAAVAAPTAGEIPAPDPAALAPAQKTLVAREAVRLKLDRDPAVVAKLAKVRTEVAVDRLVRDAAKEPTEAEMKKAFHVAADGAKLQGVIVKTKAEAVTVKGRLEQGAAVADESKGSIEPVSRQAKGELGWMPRSAMTPEMAAAVFASAAGKVLGPFPTKEGFAVVRVAELSIATDARYQEVRPQMLVEAREFAVRRARAELVQRRTAAVKPTVDDKFLDAVAGKEPTADDRKHAVARVGKDTITYGQVLDTAAANHGGGAKLPPQMAKPMVAKLVEQKLLEGEAQRVGAAKRPEAVKAYERAREEVLVAAYYQWVASQVGDATDAELQAYFEKNKEHFKTGDAEPKLDDVKDRARAAYKWDRIQVELKTRIANLERSERAK
jgi:peptidyl-prolyl cis-trans isomerase C